MLWMLFLTVESLWTMTLGNALYFSHLWTVVHLFLLKSQWSLPSLSALVPTSGQLIYTSYITSAYITSRMKMIIFLLITLVENIDFNINIHHKHQWLVHSLYGQKYWTPPSLEEKNALPNCCNKDGNIIHVLNNCIYTSVATVLKCMKWLYPYVQVLVFGDEFLA